MDRGKQADACAGPAAKYLIHFAGNDSPDPGKLIWMQWGREALDLKVAELLIIQEVVLQRTERIVQNASSIQSC